MFFRKSIGFIVILFIVSGLVNAQTPGPLPGTPLALTCMPFTDSPGLGAVESINNWDFLDRVCIVLENDTGVKMEIAGLQGYFANTAFPLISQLRVWEVHNETLLPDVVAAATLKGTYDFAASTAPGSPLVSLVTFDLTTYPGTPMPVINPGKKFVVDIINVTETESMKMAAEIEGECPPQYWAEKTNIFGKQVGATLTWNFKEDIGLSTNFYLGVTYFEKENEEDPETPAMGTIGLIGLLVTLSFALTKRNKKRS